MQTLAKLDRAIAKPGPRSPRGSFSLSIVVSTFFKFERSFRELFSHLCLDSGINIYNDLADLNKLDFFRSHIHHETVSTILTRVTYLIPIVFIGSHDPEMLLEDLP